MDHQVRLCLALSATQLVRRLAVTQSATADVVRQSLTGAAHAPCISSSGDSAERVPARGGLSALRNVNTTAYFVWSV